MMNVTNLEFFRTHSQVNRDYYKRAQYLETQIKALKEYHKRLECHKGTSLYNRQIKIKRNIISRLIAKYELLQEKIQKRIGE